MAAQASIPARASIRTVALPSEHGGWGLTLEPVVLGLLVAPTLAGLGLGVAAVMAFLVRHPLKLWLSDLRRGRRYPRTALAARFAIGYASMGLIGLVLTIRNASGPWWWPLLVGAPLALLQLHHDARGMSRNPVAQAAGTTAISGVVAAIALAGGMELQTAAGLWLVLAMRGLAALVYARAQVLRGRGARAATAPVYSVEGLAVGVLAVAAGLGLSPWLSVLGLALLLGFSAYSFARPPVPARAVGWSQMAFGLLMVLLTAIGVRTGL